jgi:hypothetical protein
MPFDIHAGAKSAEDANPRSGVEAIVEMATVASQLGCLTLIPVRIRTIVLALFTYLPLDCF